MPLPRSRPLVLGAALGATALTALALAGCGAVDKALDCADTAVTVGHAADDLQQAVSDGSKDPKQARQSLDRIAKSLGKIDKNTGDSDVGKAVGDMSDAVDNSRKALDAGREPDVGPVGSAAHELTKVCKPR